MSYQPDQKQLASVSPAAPLVKYLMRPLDPWLGNPATEDIAINRPGEAWVYQHGAWGYNRVALDYEDLEFDRDPCRRVATPGCRPEEPASRREAARW